MTTTHIAEIEAAIDIVHTHTGTRREFVSVLFAHGGDEDGWGWVVSTTMHRFTTARGSKPARCIEADGFGRTPGEAAHASVALVKRYLEAGYGGEPGRVEIAA